MVEQARGTRSAVITSRRESVGGRHRRRSRRARDERDLAEEVAGPSVVHLPALARTSAAPSRRMKNSRPRSPSLSSSLPAGTSTSSAIEAISAISPLRAVREERHLTDQVDLCVLPEPHESRLYAIRSARVQSDPADARRVSVMRLSGSRRRRLASLSSVAVVPPLRWRPTGSSTGTVGPGFTINLFGPDGLPCQRLDAGHLRGRGRRSLARAQLPPDRARGRRVDAGRRRRRPDVHRHAQGRRYTFVCDPHAAHDARRLRRR